MSTDQLTLVVDAHFRSPYAMSAFVALQEKALPFELKPLDLSRGEHTTAAYATLSLTGRVPTLIHGDFALSESSAISEYLEECFPAPRHVAVYPREPRDRARARQIQAWLRSDLMPIREERSTEVIFFQPTARPLSDQARQAAAKLFAIATRLLDGRLSLFDEWSIADTDLALMLNRLMANGDDVPPQLTAYVQRQWQRPSIQRWLAQHRPPG